MNASTFDTLSAARNLEAAGIERAQAEAIAGVMRDAQGVDRGDPATGGELYRALWLRTAALIGAQIASAGFVVHLLSGQGRAALGRGGDERVRRGEVERRVGRMARARTGQAEGARKLAMVAQEG